MVAAIECLPDFRVAVLRQLSRQSHRYLARSGNAAIAFLAGQLPQADVIVLGHNPLNVVDAELPGVSRDIAVARPRFLRWVSLLEPHE